jgi:hypothetical protein
MSDLTSITDLTLDGTSIQQDPMGIYLEITRGLNEIPVFRGSDTTVPHLTGQIAHAHVAHVRRLELTGYVLGVGADLATQQSDYRQLMRGLSSLLATAAASPVVLAGTLEDGSTASINVRVSDYQLNEPVQSLVGEPKVALESLDPYWVIVDAGS